MAPAQAFDSTPRAGVTRIAPSPTGALHLGNARTFLVNWALARRNGWRVALRMEDLDGPRVKPEASEQAIDTLRWLGIDWDEGPTYQLGDLSPYQAALKTLAEDGRVYPCQCTRSEIVAAQSAPHADEHELRYPGTCRPEAAVASPTAGVALAKPSAAVEAAEASPSAWRLRVPDEDVAFRDELAGERRVNVQQQVGDFVVATKQGLPAYQLAVVVDDARQGVTDVVRGDDLLDSTARQLWLYRMLGLTPPRRWWHLPLIYGPDGRRLAKRHGDTRLASYREAGTPAERVVGLLARWSGIGPADGPARPMSARAFAEAFKMERLPRRPITFTQEDHAWLMASD